MKSRTAVWKVCLIRHDEINEIFTILIEGFVLVLQCFLVLLLELDSFGHFLRFEDRFHSGLILKMFHVVAIRQTKQWVKV